LRISDWSSDGCSSDLTIKAEVERLLHQFGERRDMQLKSTDFTSRKMTMVEGPNIGSNSPLTWALYNSPTLNRILRAIAREEVLPCPDISEELFMARQERKGATHGLHWGDYSFALIWILQAPPIEVGGLLQCVPHTAWNKEKPRVNEYLCRYPVDTYYFSSGDVYFLRTDTTLHGTVPLREDATRVMFNMTYAGRANCDLAIDETDNWWSRHATRKCRIAPCCYGYAFVVRSCLRRCRHTRHGPEESPLVRPMTKTKRPCNVQRLN